jgi:Zn-dependent peptidase ImmA (M78 family)/transcriptional regulator with XRE-family HTH domain
MNATFHSSSNLAQRITAARERSGLTQAQLSQHLGFRNRQTLEQMESGLRKVTPEELLAIMAATGCELEYFTDPFRLVGEGAFSYRASGTKDPELDAYEDKAGKWLALWRHLGAVRGERPKALRPKLALNVKSRFEEAQSLGEALAEDLQLGAVPAEKLEEAMEDRLQILVLHVDLPQGVSGAAIQLPLCDAVLIPRSEPPGRRAFDLAHELFHVLTWDAMPPERVDRQEPQGYKSKRIEQLADNFAGALLMPGAAIRAHWERRPPGNTPDSWMQAIAEHFKVSPSAVYWRLAALQCVDPGATPKPSSVGESTVKKQRPLFSRAFLERMVWGIEHGEISLNRLLKILGVSLGEFRETCAGHGVEVEIGL